MENTTLWEKKVIGGILSGAVHPSAVDLDPSDMSELGPALQICKELGDKTSPELLSMKLAERFDDLFYTADDFRCYAKTAVSASVVFEAIDRVKGAALKAFLKSTLADLLADDSKSGAAMLDALKTTISRADKDYKTLENNFLLMKDIVPKLEAVLRDFHEGVSYAITTGFPRIDNILLDGFSKGDLHIIVGLTGHGKSALALNFARYQAQSGIFVGILSREMSEVENAMRIQSSWQQIPRWQMKKGIYDTTFEELKQGMKALADLPIAFDVRTNDINSLGVQVKWLCDQHEMKILYVDYLQLVGAGDRRGSRAEEVAAVSRGLKLIAMENNIPVVALSQFNRGAMTADVTDLLGHLKESSGIEQDASTISYIQIDNSIPDAKVKPAKIQVLKNRNGTTFTPILLDYLGETFTFSETGY